MRKKILIILTLVLTFSILLTTANIGALADKALSLLEADSAIESDIKYEKPSIGDITQDGLYPDEIKSEASANAQPKEWYEYITYSKKPVGEVQEGKTKMVFYDPYDYSYGMIMEISNPENEFGDYYKGEEGFTTANEITVSYSVSNSTSWSEDRSIEFGFEEELEEAVSLIMSGVKFKQKFSQTIGTSHMDSGSDGSSASKEVKYNAVYFNENGTPYRWRIIKYEVKLPLYCEVQSKVNNEWVTIDTTYCLLATIQGTCREWIENGVAYMEDWRTGEPVQVEKFWNEFFDEEGLKEAYKHKLVPKN